MPDLPSEPVKYVAATVVDNWRRIQIILVLSAALGLDGANNATIGALAPQLEKAFGIGATELGLLVTASTLISALATLPFGILMDRLQRKWLLIAGIMIWSVAMLVSGFATSYLFLLLTRLVLGVLVAAATPAIASLIGDFFPAFERGRIWGYMIAGELVGTALGYLVSTSLARFISWRAAFFALALLGCGLAFAVAVILIEPVRGGLARLPPQGGAGHSNTNNFEHWAPENIDWHGIRPNQNKIIRSDPATWSLRAAAKSV